MKNAEVVNILNDIARLLKNRRENRFKIRAYENAADFIQDMPEEVEDLAREGRLREIPGVGEAIEKKISELVTIGRLEYYEKLKVEPAEVEHEHPA